VNVLFIVMEFAPVNTTGNFRSTKFVKFLSSFGVNPIVVTFPVLEASEAFNAKVDENLLQEIPSDTKIYRVPINMHKFRRNRIRKSLNIFLSLSDTFASAWEKNLNAALPAIIEAHQPAAIFTSLPPFSSGLLSLKIARRFKLPLIVDMRDLWACWGSNPQTSRIHFWLKKRAERKLFRGATSIIGVTPQLLQIFKKTHPGIPESSFVLIENGYDGNIDFTSNGSFRKEEKFVIGYTGSFYYDPNSHINMSRAWWKRKGLKKFHFYHHKENWLYRSPWFFLKALQQLLIDEPLLSKQIEFVLIGDEPEWLQDMLSETGLQNIYKPYGFQSHKKALELQGRFDAFLATSEKVNGGNYCLPSKLFDYILNLKPILAFVTDGTQKEFLQQTGMAFLCNPDDSKSAATVISNLIKYRPEVRPVNEFLIQYHRQNLSKKLAEVIKNTAKINSL
jgi:glycosyltransferase involved in cell wall biosynthesis